MTSSLHSLLRSYGREARDVMINGAIYAFILKINRMTSHVQMRYRIILRLNNFMDDSYEADV
jgi:hypothetical protein